MNHVLHYYAQAAARSLSLETTGDPRSANSAAPQGCVGQGYGAACPMSTAVQLVPVENVTAASTTAQGIVTRMGQDPQGLGGEAIEPGFRAAKKRLKEGKKKAREGQGKRTKR